MTKLSKNFSLEEFACNGNNCCDNTAIASNELINGLQKLRDVVGPIEVTCGFRCKKHNKEVKGSANNSFHTLGIAADIKSSKYTANELYDIADKIDEFNGLGLYKSWIHVDCRKGLKTKWRKND